MALTFSKYDKLQSSDTAPNFSLKSVDGKRYSLENFKDAKAILIVFMCNHCPYVIPKINSLKKLQTDFNNLILIGINSNNNPDYPADNFDASVEFAKNNNLNFIYLFDETQEVAKAYGATCTPDPFLFDKEFKLFYHGRIDDKHGSNERTDKQELRAAIEALMADEKYEGEILPSCGCSIKWANK